MLGILLVRQFGWKRPWSLIPLNTGYITPLQYFRIVLISLYSVSHAKNNNWPKSVLDRWLFNYIFMVQQTCNVSFAKKKQVRMCVKMFHCKYTLLRNSFGSFRWNIIGVKLVTDNNVYSFMVFTFATCSIV